MLNLFGFGTTPVGRFWVYYLSIVNKKEYSALVTAASGVILLVVACGFAIYELACFLRGTA